MPTDSRLAFTWLGHSTFLFTSPGGKRVLIDPFLTANPRCPDEYKRIDALDLLLITHGHEDHASDAVSVARATGAPVVATYELCTWLESKGVQATQPMGMGGTQEIAGISITMVQAIHTGGLIVDGKVIYAGAPAGYVLRFEDGLVIYHAGDTALFSDMRLIGELYRPSIAFLPIGDRFTMGPDAAARACQLLGVRQVVPMHYGTFPFLTGRPERFRELVEPLGVTMVDLQPGETAS